MRNEDVRTENKGNEEEKVFSENPWICAATTVGDRTLKIGGRGRFDGAGSPTGAAGPMNTLSICQGIKQSASHVFSCPWSLFAHESEVGRLLSTSREFVCRVPCPCRACGAVRVKFVSGARMCSDSVSCCSCSSAPLPHCCLPGVTFTSPFFSPFFHFPPLVFFPFFILC